MTYTQEITLAGRFGMKYALDPHRGGPWCKFKKADWHVWKCNRAGVIMWATASLENGHYTRHRYFSTLEEAFRACV